MSGSVRWRSDVKFSSVKHAIGWFVARRRGPTRLQAFDPASRFVRTPYVDHTRVYCQIARLFVEQPPTGLGLAPGGRALAYLLQWGSTSDDAGLVPPACLEELEELLIREGLLERVEVPRGGPFEFVDLNSGRIVRTWREDD